MGAVTAAADTVVDNIRVGFGPNGVAVTLDGTRVYVTNFHDDSLSVIETASNTASATVRVGSSPEKVAVTPDGSHAYVANSGDDSVSVIETATNTVVRTVTVGVGPEGVAATPDGSRVYVTNFSDGSLSVIETADDTVGGFPRRGDRPGRVPCRRHRHQFGFGIGDRHRRMLRIAVLRLRLINRERFGNGLPRLAPALVEPHALMSNVATVPTVAVGGVRSAELPKRRRRPFFPGVNTSYG